MSLIDVDAARTDEVLRAIARHPDTDRIHIFWQVLAIINPHDYKRFGKVVQANDLEDAARDEQVAAFADIVSEIIDEKPELDDEWEASLEEAVGEVADALEADVGTDC